MAAKTKSNFKSWIIVYVGFALALITANSGVKRENYAPEAIPGVRAVDIVVDKAFFQPITNQSSRNDI